MSAASGYHEEKYRRRRARGRVVETAWAIVSKGLFIAVILWIIFACMKYVRTHYGREAPAREVAP